MNTTEANRTPSGYVLKSELARLCLPSQKGDPGRKLAWVNSVCLLFLLIGIFGGKAGSIRIAPLSPIDEAIPIVEPLPPPPPPVSDPQPQDPTEDRKPDSPQAVTVTLEAPNIIFSVPTIGNLLVPSAVAKAPPLNPLQPPTPLKNQPANVENTGQSGDRPQPPYPGTALKQQQQGTVTLSLTADEAGKIIGIEVKQSSGFPILDRSALDYVKRHWLLPRGAAGRLFETSIIYRLEPN